MNYHNITNEDMLNGEGVRVVLWVSGCEHACKGCQNPQTWSKTSGIAFDEEAKRELFEKLENKYIDGITFSGGDPLAHYNREVVTDLARTIKNTMPKKTIWVYSGYKYEDIKDLEIMQYVDVLVDGKFDLENRQRNPRIQWRGDDSQRIIDVQSSRKENKVIERKDLY